MGSSGDSYYPYELTNLSRLLEKCELEQPKKSKSEYVVVHDVATSDKQNADQAVTTVIKLKPKINGDFAKEVVYSKAHKGMPLQEQRDFLRQLVHLKFPNTIKLVIDAMGNGEHLPQLFYETWEHVDEKTNQTIEYPPLISDDDENASMLKGAIPMIRAVKASTSYNNTMYSYMKNCFENGTLKLLVPQEEVDNLYKTDQISAEENAVYVETDSLLAELSNIKQVETESKNIVYDRIVKTEKRDRVTSLGYGLHYIHELESENKLNLGRDEDSSYFDYLF